MKRHSPYPILDTMKARRLPTREVYLSLDRWARQAISVPANVNPKDATSCRQAQSPRVDHTRDRVPDSRPHKASDRSNSIDW